MFYVLEFPNEMYSLGHLSNDTCFTGSGTVEEGIMKACLEKG